LPLENFLGKINVMRDKKVKALVLLSGGLDSILAVKLLLEQGIEVVAVNFRTNFCGPSKARPAAAMLSVPLREVAIREDFLEVLKKPKYGYGAGLNPCIDCHALMLKKAAEIMNKEDFDFVATGEVLGERPMSQHKQALEIVEKEAGLKGYLLRPLSAKCLEPTIPEIDGRVNREKLLGISGRNRKPQMDLAKKFGIREYPTPAGGCALTQEGFTDRLKELMEHNPDFDFRDVDLVRFGRHYWLNNIRPSSDEEGVGGGVDLNIKHHPTSILPSTEGRRKPNQRKIQIILGRNERENEILSSVAGNGDIIIEPDNFVGPTALVRGKKISEETTKKAKDLIIKFSPKAKNLARNKLTLKIVSDKNE